MRVVLDSNVLISAALFDGVPEKTVLKILKNNTLVLSPYIIKEVGNVLRLKFKRDPQQVTLFQQVLSQNELHYFDPYLHILNDEPDNRILETAVVGKAAYIVTGDKLLLGLKRYKTVKLVSPADFLNSHA